MLNPIGDPGLFNDLLNSIGKVQISRVSMVDEITEFTPEQYEFLKQRRSDDPNNIASKARIEIIDDSPQPKQLTP